MELRCTHRRKKISGQLKNETPSLRTNLSISQERYIHIKNLKDFNIHLGAKFFGR